MHDIEKLKEAHAASLAEAVESNRICLALPVMPKSVGFANKSIPWVTYEVQTLADALDIFRQYTPHPWQIGKGTFTTLAPAEEFARKKSYSYDSFTDIDGAPYFDCWTMPSHATNELVFFTQSAGRLLRVAVRIAQCPIRTELRLNSAFSRTDRDRYTKSYPRPDGAHVLRWGYDDGSAKGTYWFPDLDTFWTSMARYVPTTPQD